MERVPQVPQEYIMNLQDQLQSARMETAVGASAEMKVRVKMGLRVRE
jgi:hypothetical protein